MIQNLAPNWVMVSGDEGGPSKHEALAPDSDRSALDRWRPCRIDRTRRGECHGYEHLPSLGSTTAPPKGVQLSIDLKTTSVESGSNFKGYLRATNRGSKAFMVQTSGNLPSCMSFDTERNRP